VQILARELAAGTAQGLQQLFLAGAEFGSHGDQGGSAGQALGLF
jgi:hypothetical protein